MDGVRKVTVTVSADLAQAQRASRAGVAETVRMGLQPVAASEAYSLRRELRGKGSFSRRISMLKAAR
jgi:hypothetical protein